MMLMMRRRRMCCCAGQTGVVCGRLIQEVHSWWALMVKSWLSCSCLRTAARNASSTSTTGRSRAWLCILKKIASQSATRAGRLFYSVTLMAGVVQGVGRAGAAQVQQQQQQQQQQQALVVVGVWTTMPL